MENKSFIELKKEYDSLLKKRLDGTITKEEKNLLIQINQEMLKQYIEVKEMQLKSIPSKKAFNIYFLIILIMIAVLGIYIYKSLN